MFAKYFGYNNGGAHVLELFVVKRMFETTSKRIYSTEETRQRVLADSDAENNDLEELNSQESLSDSESGCSDRSARTG